MNNLREISVKLIEKKVAELCIEANIYLSQDIKDKICSRCKLEPFEPAKNILEQIKENYHVAQETSLPICQDTGMLVVFANIGQDVHIVDGDFEKAINDGVAEGYTKGFLRKSIVEDPIRRINTNDNTPAVIHTKIVPGDKIELIVSPKGFGSENMSRLKMLNPADGIEGVKNFVIETVNLAGANPCPPMILGIGIGGTFEKVAQLAKEALILPLDVPNPDPFYAKLEKELLEAVNKCGIGPQGFGGETTALGLHVLTYPTHIAGLPVAVNTGCHVTRHASIII